MKKSILVLSVILISTLSIQAQSKKDSLAVEKVCRDYVEGWAEGDVERVKSAVSPELVKRSIAKGQVGENFTVNMSASQLLFVTQNNKENGIRSKDLEPDKEFKLDVFIYDISGNYALAKTFNSKYGFFDYCQLAKVNGEWKIINVLYGWPPKEQEK